MVSRSGGSIEIQLTGADAVGLLEDRERAPARVEHGRAHFLAIEVGRRLDARLLERHDRGGRVVVDHHHGDRLVGRIRVVGVEFHESREVGEAHVVAARGYAGDGTAGPVARVDDDIEPGLLEVAFGHGREEERRRTLEPPVELELDRHRLGLCNA
jgi:hypothetical protein